VRPPRLLAVVLAALAVALVACSGPEAPGAPTVSDETIKAIQLDGQWNWQKQDRRLELGVTHTEDSLDPEEPDNAQERGTKVLSNSSAIWQNHHLMGFGTLNPEPAAGEYEWESLDRRMQLTEDTGDRAVLTLCCAPDWMKGGAPGETDWSRLEEAPKPENFDDFAALAAAAVLRYPQVERVLVWNELKGFYRTDENRWNYEGYTELYNKVYKAVKDVRPDVQVGGPYAVLTSLDPGSPDASEVSGPWGVADQRALDILDYWLANNVGADFIAVDGATGTRQGTIATPADMSAQKYADLTTWIRKRTPLAIWWAEFYPDVPAGTKGGASSPASAASTLAAVAAYAQSGVSIALLWGPQGSSLEYAALWTDSREEDGGEPTPLTEGWQWLVPRLAKGEVEIGRSPTLPLLAFRAPDGALVVNLTGAPVDVKPGTDPLPPWAITLTSRDS
jgi:Glycosyl hydrolases family 39.